MASISMTLVGGDALVRSMQQYLKRTKDEVEAAKHLTAYAIAADWKRNSNVYIYDVPRRENAYELTGDFRASITAERVAAYGGWTVHDGVEYGARLEFGFIGQDKLGRTYNQAGRPMLRKAIERNKNRYIKGLKTAIKFRG